jgi:MFS family permease
MVGPIIGGHLTDLTGTFRWAFGLGAFASFFAGILIGFLRKPRDIAKKED